MLLQLECVYFCCSVNRAQARATLLWVWFWEERGRFWEEKYRRLTFEQFRNISLQSQISSIKANPTASQLGQYYASINRDVMESPLSNVIYPKENAFVGTISSKFLLLGQVFLKLRRRGYIPYPEKIKITQSE